MRSSAALSAVRVFASLLLAPALSFAQADYAREKRWADEVTPAILVGDPVYLAQKNGHKFLAIWAPNPNAVAGVIVVHGLGVHPDWGLINPLRSQLSEQGYATLSVQMPVLEAEARGDRYPPLFPESAERLAAAVAFLRGKGLNKVAIVSHSLGSRMTNYFLNHTDDARIDAWVTRVQGKLPGSTQAGVKPKVTITNASASGATVKIELFWQQPEEASLSLPPHSYVVTASVQV